jgi:phage terminase small subunit
MLSTQPPDHLSASAAEWWRSTVDRYELDPHHLKLLELMLGAWDMAEQAREILAVEGMLVPTGAGGSKAHPAVAILRDARLAVARLVRELDLDVAPPASERVGPLPIFSNRGRNARKASHS